MAKGSKSGACSAHVDAARANCLRHNRRDGNTPSYVNHNLTPHNRTVYEDATIAGRKSIAPLIEAARKEYTEKTGQRCQKSFAPIREDVLSFPGRGDITDEQLMTYKTKVEQLTGWRVLGIWVHQDEGYARSKYIEGDTGYAINHHAHILYDCQDHRSGKAIRVNKSYLSKRQDLLAEATGMERGNPAAITGRARRDAAHERIHQMEQRLGTLQAELDRMTDERDKAAKAVKKAVWEQIGNLVGVGQAPREIARLKAANEALEAKVEQQSNEIAKHQDDIKAAKEAGARSVLRRLAKDLCLPMTRQTNPSYNYNSVLIALKDTAESLRVMSKKCGEWMEAAKDLQRQLTNQQHPSQHIKR